jgi:hypothetical protein
MLTISLRVVGIGMLLTLGACNGPPWVVSRTPDAITLRWYADETDSAAAGAAAQAHCQSSGKNAELVSYDQNGSAQIGRYRCR